MTSDEVDKLADKESKDFFLWLEGYIEGMRSRDADMVDVSTLDSKITHLRERWRSLSNRS